MERKRVPSIQTTIVVYCSIIMAILIFTANVLFFQFAQGTLKERTLKASYDVLDQVSKSINFYLSYVTDVSDLVSYNSDLRRYLSYDYKTAPVRDYLKKSFYEYISHVPDIRNEVLSIFVFDMQNKPVYMPKGLTLKPGYDITKEDWYKNAENKNGATAITSTHVRRFTNEENPWVVSISNSIVDPNTNGKLGTLLVELNYKVLNDICENVSFGENGYIFVLDNSGEFVFHPYLPLIYSGLKTEDIPLLMEETGNTVVSPSIGKTYYVNKNGDPAFRIVGALEDEKLYANSENMGLIFVLMCCISICVAILSSVVIASGIVKPIKRLENVVNEIEHGNFDVDFELEGSAETIRFAKSLEDMLGNTKRLMAQTVEDQEVIRKSQLDALHAQINPHFLYNTLDSIIWMAEERGAHDIVMISLALAKYFRISLSKGKDIITAQEELLHVENYLIIQKLRYEDKLSYNVKYGAGVRETKCLKLMLQPIVENAIYHGVKSMRSGGKVLVSGWVEDDLLFFTVEDNGPGMSKEQVEDVLEGRANIARKRGGVGVRNVQERIRLFYGDQYGLKIESKEGEGTKVTIRIPVR